MNKPRILIVEDEPGIADNIQYALETEGFDTRHHITGGGVMALVDDGEVDLIILDIGLPDINGLELCKEIRKASQVPIIFLTARADEVDRVVGLEIGADDYVIKPFSPRELTARVKAILRRAQNKKNQPVSPSQSSCFSIDESRHKIFYDDAELELSHYEFKIMKIFINRPGHVFSRDRLMDLVWDDPEMSMDRAVDAHIKNIRSKLKTIRPDLDPIVTHRSLGYSLKENL